MKGPRCLYAFTVNDPLYPPYANVTALPDGEIRLTVRGPKKPQTEDRPFVTPGDEGTIVLSREEARQLYRALLTELAPAS